MKPILLVLLVFLLTGCGAKIVLVDELESSQPGPSIIFVPGYYGSSLVDEETGELQFVTAWKSLFSGTPLALATPDLGVEGARSLKTTGVLKYIRVIPGIYSIEAYGRAVDFLTEVAGTRAEVIPFAYDWRLDLHQSATKLSALVDRLRARKRAPIYIVAHSMGSLVTSYYLRYGDQDPATAIDDNRGAAKIRAVVIAGAPFNGAATAFRNLQTGTTLATASAPLNQISLATFPSIYHLIPSPAEKAYRNVDLAPLTESLYDPKWWKQHALGLLKDQSIAPELLKKREVASVLYLKRAEQFWNRVRAPSKGKKALPFLAYVGMGRPTYSQLVWSGKSLSEKGKWDFSSKAKEDGDGLVTTTSATPPAGLLATYESRVFTGPAHHEGMFEDDAFRVEVKKFLEANGLR